MNTALPRDCDAWTEVDRRIERASDPYIPCATCFEWVHGAETLAGMCPDCIRREDDAFLDATPFLPPPDSVGRSPLMPLPASGGGSHRASPVDRITRTMLAFLAHPLTTSAARCGVVGLSLIAWGWFSARVVLP